MPSDTTFTLVKNLKDEKSLAIRDTLHKIADLKTSILIYGETGVGKDFWADYLFRIGSCERMVNLNCGDVPENLLESEWFGFKKGAFTGADKDYDGKWKQAQGGILFLNRIDLLGLNIQSKLLRIIERKKYYPLGSNSEVDIDARFVFSADFDIERKVREGKFREDLYYRISAYSIYVPPLRERKKDILPLFMYFAGQKGLQVNLSADAQKTLTDFPWSGNIRELENVVTSFSIGVSEVTDEHIYSLRKTSQDFFAAVKEKEMSMAEMERQYIEYLLKKYKNKSRVAKILGFSRKSLYNKLELYNKRGRGVEG